MADAASIANRLAASDTGLWPSGNVAADRLGWLAVVSEMRTEAKAIVDWAAGVNGECSHTVLFGMGGSSLAPEVLRVAAVASGATGAGKLDVLDTTHPATVRTKIDHATPGGLGVIASKSGTTVEPNSMFGVWRSRVTDGARSAAITDPGTKLDTAATAAGVRAVFRNRADIGGRYSALSLFGLVPAALLEYDLAALLDFDDHDLSPGVELGLHLAAEHAAGRDKVTVLASTTVAAFGLWVEQLLAESTGKRGTGLIPVAGETTVVPASYGTDRTFVAVTCGNETIEGVRALEQAGFPVVHQHIADAHGLGELFFRWEVATAVAGSQLGIDPFDEPDVAAAKAATNEVLAHWPTDLAPDGGPDAGLRFVGDAVQSGDYIALLAYLAYDDAVDRALADLQAALRDRHRLAVTRGFGPRYLHSTGQLHKGGPPSAVAVQLVAGPSATGPSAS